MDTGFSINHSKEIPSFLLQKMGIDISSRGPRYSKGKRTYFTAADVDFFLFFVNRPAAGLVGLSPFYLYFFCL